MLKLCLVVSILLFCNSFASAEDLKPDITVGYSPCPFNCSGHGTCLSNGTCDCEFGFSTNLDGCIQSWGTLYRVYVITFTILFGVIALASLFLMIRYFVSEGCNFSNAGIQKILHFLFFVMGVARVLWLVIDPHNLRRSMNPIIENLGNSFGVYVIVFAYLLLVLLWAATYKNASIGKMNVSVLKVARPVIIIMIILYGIFEVILRVIWRQVDPNGSTYKIVIFLYYFFMLSTVSFIMIAFLFYGNKMYRNLADFQEVNPMIKSRLKRITELTTGATILCTFTFVTVLISLFLEFFVFKFQNHVSFLVEQYLFRSLELLLVIMIMIFLRRSNYKKQDNVSSEENKTLLRENSASNIYNYKSRMNTMRNYQTLGVGEVK